MCSFLNGRKRDGKSHRYVLTSQQNGTVGGRWRLWAPDGTEGFKELCSDFCLCSHREGIEKLFIQGHRRSSKFKGDLVYVCVSYMWSRVHLPVCEHVEAEVEAMCFPLYFSILIVLRQCLSLNQFARLASQ